MFDHINYDSDVYPVDNYKMVMIQMMINISEGRDDADDSHIRMVQMIYTK